jgi:hypothetical protein
MEVLMSGIRRWLFAAAAVVTMAAGIATRDARAQTSFYGSASSGSFSISYFYDELADYGRWVDYGSYGACWVPADVGYGWRPYMRGYWTYTDYGWTWASYEPFGWATYHYGRWVLDPYYGWLWVPGTTWAPAWVAWREADDCIGWAPLPPQAGWSVSVGLSFSNASSHIGYDQWCFVDRDRFDTRDVSSVVYPASRNRVVFRGSRDATRFRVRDGAPFNDGVRVSSLESSLGRRIPRMRVAAVDRPEHGQGRQIDARTVGFFRPNIRGSRNDLTQRVERVERERGNARSFEGGRNLRDVQRQREGQRGRAQAVEREREQREFQRPGQRETREFQRPERGGGREIRREAPAERPQVREERGRGRDDREVRPRDSEGSKESDRDRGRGRGKGKKGGEG